MSDNLIDFATGSGPMAEHGSVIYDGRVSAKCQSTCQVGECGQPGTPEGCGTCCGCLIGCFWGHDEQCEELATEGGEPSA